MKVAHIVLCRDKAPVVAMSARSVLAQNYVEDEDGPLHVILSDQGSKDGTLDILKALKNDYSGPHRVSVLECPNTDPVGMTGANAHLQWIHDNTDAEFFLITAASDWAHPDRTARCVEAYKQHKPDMVITAQQFIALDGTVSGVTIHPKEDGMVDSAECLDQLVGGSTAQSWTREFIDAIGGFKSVASFDAYGPFLATCRKGAYFLREELHAYIQDADINNTGLEGVYRAADEDARKQIEELMHFQVCSGMVKAARVLGEWGVNTPDKMNPIYMQIIGRAASWCEIREKLTYQRTPPMAMRA